MAFRTPEDRDRKRKSNVNQIGKGNPPDEDMYRALVENAPVAIWSAPIDSFELTYVSPEAEKIFGYPREECLQAGFFKKILHPEDKEWVEEYNRLAIQQKHTYQFEYRIITKSGKVRTLRDTIRLTYRDAKPYQKVGVSSDVSVYNQTLDELQASNRKFFSAFHSFPIPAVITRIKDSKIIDVNKNFLEVSGYDRAEIIEKSAFEIDAWINPPERDYLVKMLRKNGRLEKYPVLLKDAYFRIRNVLLSAQVFDNSGESCVLLMFYDVTEQIKTEQRLQQTNRELETFMYKSSHNLKGPVASIKGLLNLAENEIKDPEGKKYVELMNQCARGLENTLEELMDIARLKQGKLQIDSVDLTSMLEDISNKLKFMPEWHCVSYQVAVQQTNPFFTDPNMLYSILQNLVENAVKYKTEKAKPWIQIKATIREKVAEIQVKDNGMGIPQEHQDRIFDMFYRAHQKSSGTGLGLYIVKDSVEKLGGTISLNSQTEKGSTFKLSFPNFQPEKEEQRKG